MVSREEVRDVLGGGGIAGALADLLINGGDLLITLVAFFADSIEIWLALASQMLRLSDRLPWIPRGAAESLMALVATIFVLVTVVRLLGRARERLTGN